METAKIDFNQIRDELKTFDLSAQQALEGDCKKLDSIENLYNVSKYKAVFIGKPGSGKTTAICNLFGILRKNKKGITPSQAALLTTAAGRTTVAEVHIRQVTTPSIIRLEYVPETRQEQFINDYCHRYYETYLRDNNKLNNEDQTGQDEVQQSHCVHEEIDRFIRNMAELEADPNPAKMSAYESETDFINKQFEKIDLSSRNKTSIPFAETFDFEEWLQTTFENLNYGKQEGCSIPKCIYVDINEQDLKLFIPPYIDEIVDTIGLDDDAQERKDLSAWMNANDAICFLMDELSGVPTIGVRNLLRFAYPYQWHYHKYKTSIFVTKASDDDLGKVNEADGDPEKGTKNKTREIDNAITVNKLPYTIGNTFFWDSFAAYETTQITEKNSKGKPIKKIVVAEYNDSAAEYYRNTFDEKVNEFLSQMRSFLQNDVKKIQADIANINQIKASKQKEATKKELTELQQKIIEWRNNLQPTFRKQDIFAEIIKNTIEKIHWATIRKINSLYGGYQRWHTDIYTKTEFAGGLLFADVSNKVFEELKIKLIDVRNELTRTLTNDFIHRLEFWIDEGKSNVENQFLTNALNECFAPQSDENLFWLTVNGIRGRGYKDNVKKQYETNLNQNGNGFENIIHEKILQIVEKLINAIEETTETL